MKQHDEFAQTEQVNDPDETFVELERYLAQALRRVDAPEGFADRVIKRAKTALPAAAEVTKATVLTMPSRQRYWVGGAVAATLLVGVFVGDQQFERRRQVRADVAQKQFEAGMQITDRALEHTRQQLERAGARLRD